MNSRGPIGLSRKAGRAASGGAIVVVALLIALFMQGPGTGTGDGDSPDKSGTAKPTELVASAAPGKVMLKSDGKDGGLTEKEQAALSGNTLNVLIDEHDYFVQVSGNDRIVWHPIELPRLVEVAQQASGDSNGIRVRIQKRNTARASAEEKILSELEQAGVGRDAVFESSELID